MRAIRLCLALAGLLVLLAAPALLRAEEGLPLAQPAGPPVAVPPGAVPLIIDVPETPGLPKNFRMMTDAFPADAAGTPPSRAGLDRLHASGSAQFSADQLRAVAERVAAPLVVVDLRQESHGLLDGIPVSWYAWHDQGNISRSLVEIVQDERLRLQALLAGSPVTLLKVTAKAGSGEITHGEPFTLTPQTAQTEADLTRSLALGYLRIPAPDFLSPTPENVDRFVAFATALPPGTWLHLHCHGGDGRTTTFLAAWDMLHNAAAVSLDDIVRRQHLLGGIDLFGAHDLDSWTHSFNLQRAEFIRRFYQYAREQAPSGFIMPWSVWSAAHPAPPAAGS